MSNDKKNGIPRRLLDWFKKAQEKAGPSIKRSTASIRRRLPRDWRARDGKFDPKEMLDHPGWFRWGLLIVGTYLAAEIAANVTGVLVRPSYLNVPKKAPVAQGPIVPEE